ncbi:M48 family metallopeptidase [Saccharopolyspora cebuensis]|uniref:M48 family metallopeptidase n=1 Tax=Saccharopolyspora cebuensis TaxID=418759 RepID=A0ABV4CIF6_9PSEU
MRGPWRAAVALALHLGFFAVPIALVLGLLAIALYTFRYDRGSGLEAALAALVVGAVFAIGLRAVLSTRVDPRGVALRRDEQPQLWKLVSSIADAAGAEPPDEIRVTSEPGIAIVEDTALLGLRTRGRYLEIGMPLLAALTISELRALLAREIGMLGGSGTAVTARRCARTVERTVASLTSGPVKWLFGGYARAYTAVAAPVSFQLEPGADRLAVRVAGKRAAITALRKRVAIELGWRDYAEEFLSMATTVGHTPDVILGFRAFMDHPARKPALAERAKQAIAEGTDRTDGGPPTRDRIAAMKQLKSADRELDDRPAFGALREPRTSVPALEDELVVEGLGARLPWPELVRLAGAAQAAQQAAQLSSAIEQSGLQIDPAIGGVLAAIHRGQARDLINPALNPGLDPERLDQAAEDMLVELLGGAVVDALVCARRAHHELDWGGPPLVRLAAGGQPLDPDRLVRPAVADPRLIPGLHRTLVDLGVPLNHLRPPEAEPEPALSGIISPVQVSGTGYELLVTDRGLVLLPSQASSTKRLLSGALARLRKAEYEQLDELAATPVAELRDQPGAHWVDTRDVATARLVQLRAGWTLRLEMYLDEYAVSALPAEIVADEEGVAEVELSSTGDAMEHGDPYGGIGELMGARMIVEDTTSGANE